MFRFVSCPNYTCEIMVWLCFNMIFWSFWGTLFAIVGALQMTVWALKKHKRYREEFPEYPKHRKAIIPFLL